VRTARALPRLAGALLFWSLLPVSAAERSPPEVKPWPGPTPALRLQDLDGRAVDLASLRGRAVLVNFWATWCDPCREEMPALERVREKLKGRPFDVLLVNYGESAATISRFLPRLGITLPVLLDPEKKVADEWKVRGLPMTFLVGADGRIRFWIFGEQDWSEGEAYALIERAVVEAQRARR
jgi:thiol-disulfide isomerase/thioredoxin